MAAYFSLILVLVTLVSGLIWLIDVVFFAPKRRENLLAAQANSTQLSADAIDKIIREPVLVETAHSIFPVIAFVMILRSFIYEPFQIPSGSMMPTLLVGDFILVEKFSYGLRDPVWRSKLVETGEPERGDVFVFKYPENPKIDYIKRVVGLPGDKIFYRNKQLMIQEACDSQVDCPAAKTIEHVEINRGEFSHNGVPLIRSTEQLGDVKHDILIDPSRPDFRQHFYPQAGLPAGEFVVPKGMYFAMGDNRDNSTDSRFWGFVPEENLVGKAVAIWISFEFDRQPSDMLPAWVPTGVRFDRVGGIH
ncbi:signal peptidase I [Shewanella sp. SR43-4]|uniref:signal peptidase I n=1 Tax=Shewanella TaxID=22 RepID=UPI000C3EF329|nr:MULTISPECIES: signal peptidase I [Shewanella]NCQ44640.1 signal peptidase I [Shewanella frigidimarina]MBB1318695.1 signal peptidase I [Shewanella sp. SR43-4]MBB1474240.1 signal peptidase I [Shewanella sp. SG41-3]NCO72940.1 signal peptidase I [Shewanella vesiculosa]NCP35983.1 signal peptidase I [Shewanella vesiculosa]